MSAAEVDKHRRRVDYRCGKCGQPKKGHVCSAEGFDWDQRRTPLSIASPVVSGSKQDTARDSKRRRLDAGPPSAEAGASTVAVEAVAVEAVAVAVEAVAVEAVAVEAEAVAVEAEAVEAVAVEAVAVEVVEAAALHVAAEVSAAFQLATDDAELAAAEASAEQRVRRLRDDLERVEAAMISAQAGLAELRRQHLAVAIAAALGFRQGHIHALEGSHEALALHRIPDLTGVPRIQRHQRRDILDACLGKPGAHALRYPRQIVELEMCKSLGHILFCQPSEPIGFFQLARDQAGTRRPSGSGSAQQSDRELRPQRGCSARKRDAGSG